MNKKQKSTLKSIYEKPPRSDIEWADIESLLKSLGSTFKEGNGARVRVKLNGVKAVFHRPHPEKESDKGQVSSVRTFLDRAGIKPETKND